MGILLFPAAFSDAFQVDAFEVARNLGDVPAHGQLGAGTPTVVRVPAPVLVASPSASLSLSAAVVSVALAQRVSIQPPAASFELVGSTVQPRVTQPSVPIVIRRGPHTFPVKAWKPSQGWVPVSFVAVNPRL